MASKICMTIARFCLTAWIGAASMFVTAITLAMTTKERSLNDTTVKNALTAVSFPAYYLFGFVLVATTGIALLLGRFLERKTEFGQKTGRMSRLRFIVCCVCLFAGLSLMIYDYYAIFTPLLESMPSPEEAKTAAFTKYHIWSRYINTVDVGLLFVSAVLLCWPLPSAENQS